MVQGLDTSRKPGMKASLMTHNAVTTLIITSKGKEIKDGLRKNMGALFSWKIPKWGLGSKNLLVLKEKWTWKCSVNVCVCVFSFATLKWAMYNMQWVTDDYIPSKETLCYFVSVHTEVGWWCVKSQTSGVFFSKYHGVPLWMTVLAGAPPYLSCGISQQLFFLFI